MLSERAWRQSLQTDLFLKSTVFVWKDEERHMVGKERQEETIVMGVQKLRVVLGRINFLIADILIEVDTFCI